MTSPCTTPTQSPPPQINPSADPRRWIQAQAADRLIGLIGLIGGDGVAVDDEPEVHAETFQRVLDTNVNGSVHAARVALRQFREQGHGTLVLTGSLLGEIATPYMSSYVTSKWAVRLARVLAIEARDLPDVHVCIVSPGGVDTPVYLQAANYAGLDLQCIPAAAPVRHQMARAAEAMDAAPGHRDPAAGFVRQGGSVAATGRPWTGNPGDHRGRLS